MRGNGIKPYECNGVIGDKIGENDGANSLQKYCC